MTSHVARLNIPIAVPLRFCAGSWILTLKSETQPRTVIELQSCTKDGTRLYADRIYTLDTETSLGERGDK